MRKDPIYQQCIEDAKAGKLIDHGILDPESVKRSLEIQRAQIDEQWRMRIRHQVSGVFRLPKEANELINRIEGKVDAYSLEEAKMILPEGTIINFDQSDPETGLWV